MFLRERGLVTIIFIRGHSLEVRLNDLLADRAQHSNVVASEPALPSQRRERRLLAPPLRASVRSRRRALAQALTLANGLDPSSSVQENIDLPPKKWTRSLGR